MAMSYRTDLLTLCAALQQAGIWLSLNEADQLLVGPSALVKKHPELLQGVRTHKAAIIQLLEESLAHSLFGDQADDPRFEREDCPDCHQSCLIVLGPRRLGVHRLPGGTAVCPGSDRAQHATADVIMWAFVNDRCLHRPGAVLSWYAIRGALEAWCAERTFILPPRPFLLAWLDKQFARHGDEDRPMWAGLQLTLPEWGLDDTPDDAKPETPSAIRPKLVLKA